MKNRELLLAIVALGVLLLGLTPYPRAFTGGMQQAEAHRAAREYGAALQAYRRAAGHDPKSPLPWLRMGEVLLGQRRFIEATIVLREAERLDGGVPAVLALGESYAGRGDWATAMRTWLRAQTLAPEDTSDIDRARLYINLGRAAMAQGRFDQAVGYLTQALQPDLPAEQAANAHALLGRLLVDDDPARAAHHFQQAGDEDMLNVLLAASESGPDPAGRDLLLGVAFLQRGELPLARRQFERAIAGEPNGAEAHAYLAHTLDRMGETVAAAELLDRALALDPDSALAYYFFAAHRRQVGNMAEGQTALWEALLRDPENAALHVEMAETLVDLGDYPGAEEWYQDAVELAPDDVEFQLLLARFYLDHLYRVEEGGLPAAQTAANLAPGDPRTYDLLGWAYHLAGRQVEGRLALEQALEMESDLVSALYHLGSLNATLDQQQLACQYLQRTVDLDTEGYYRNRAAAVMVDLGCEETQD